VPVPARAAECVQISRKWHMPQRGQRQRQCTAQVQVDTFFLVTVTKLPGKKKAKVKEQEEACL